MLTTRGKLLVLRPAKTSLLENLPIAVKQQPGEAGADNY